MVPVPTFHPDGGECTPEGSVRLKLSGIDATLNAQGYKVLYTMDFSDPDATGNTSTLTYRSPIGLGDARGGEMLIRAVVVGKDGMPGRQVARAFHVKASAEPTPSQTTQRIHTWQGFSKPPEITTETLAVAPKDLVPLPHPQEGEVTSLDYLSGLMTKEGPDNIAAPPGDIPQYVCDSCGRSWSAEERMLKHKEFCRGPSRPSLSRSPSRKVHWEGKDSSSCNSGAYNRSHDSGGTGNYSFTPSALSTFSARSSSQNQRFSQPASTQSSITRTSNSGWYGSKPNIKSPSRKPLAQPKGMVPCPYCAKEMRQAALDTHIKRCPEEPSNKKQLFYEAESRRKLSSSRRSSFSTSPVSEPDLPPMTRHSATFASPVPSPEIVPTSPAARIELSSESGSNTSSRRPIRPSSVLQGRRDAWKRARAKQVNATVER